MQHGDRADVSVALLVGGLSERMGEEKAFIPFMGGTLLEWMRDLAVPLFRHVFVVSRDPSRFQDLGLPVVNDALAERGSAVGVYTAILAAPNERVICLACDMPFVSPRLLWELAGGSENFDIFVPRHGERIEPLCAVYSTRVAEAFRQFILAGGRRIFDLYPSVDTGFLEIDQERFGDPERLFLNVNTPRELEKARAWAANTDHNPLKFLAPRVQAFLKASPLPVVSFVGRKKSGKTTVVIGVIEELRRRGYKLAVIKHDAHGFEMDVPGTDSYRFREAGAEVVGISSPDKYVWIAATAEEHHLATLVRQIREPVDLVITEGFKREAAPKIEVSRRARSAELVSDSNELIGIVSDQFFPTYPGPQLAMDDFTGVADLIEKSILTPV